MTTNLVFLQRPRTSLQNTIFILENFAKTNRFVNKHLLVKFKYSEKATKFCKIFTLILSYVVPVKSKGKISQNFVVFSEYMNFTLH